MGKRIGIVILNYKKYEETLECVDSILQQTYENYQIVIVENGSQNESLHILQSKYGKEDNITVLNSEQNVGFARGNNIGIKYAKEELKCDDIFVINSDIIMPPKILEQYLKIDTSGVGIISPTVYSLDQKEIFPSGNTNNMYKKFFRTVFDILLTSMLQITIVEKIYHRVRPKRSESTETAINQKTEWKYSVSGCAFVLTEHFFEYYTQMYPKTFLYWEEMNLLMYLQKVGLVSKVIKTDPLIHKEGRSTREKHEKVDMRKVLKQSRESMRKSWFMYFMPYTLIKKLYN